MFTGIVEELGEVVALERGPGDQADAARLSVRGPLVAEGTRTGDSISVNGCCLTVTDLSDDVFVADVMARPSRGPPWGLWHPEAGSTWNAPCASATA